VSSSSSSDVVFAPGGVDATFLRRFEDSFLGAMEPVLEGMGTSRTELEQTIRDTGEIRVVLVDGEDAGSLWIELRERTLHVHALLLDPAFRRRGIGSRVLSLLEDEYLGRADELELGVQEGNEPAERLYEKAGFVEVGARPELGFRVLRRALRR
jgi:ribosomal protein S18 acetylase RimI-like enzyme